MTELTLHYYAKYLTRPMTPRPKPIVFAAQNLVKCLKDEKVIGRGSKIPYRGSFAEITPEKIGPAIGLAAQFFADTIEQHTKGNVVIVPVPSSKQDVTSKFRSRVEQLADRTLKKMKSNRAVVVSALRWSEKMTSAHKGGGRRDRAFRGSKLRVVEHIPDGTIVLLDDVCTTGGTLLAAMDVLGADDHDVSFAIAAALAVRTLPDPPFGPFEIDLPMEADDEGASLFD